MPPLPGQETFKYSFVLVQPDEMTRIRYLIPFKFKSHILIKRKLDLVISAALISISSFAVIYLTRRDSESCPVLEATELSVGGLQT